MELLVVLTVIALLFQLLLPAIESAREAARRTQCQANLRQLAIASIHHETAQGHFPSGGWDWWWVGDPDRGYGIHQPGGWAFNVLAFIEMEPLRNAGRGLTGRERAVAIRGRCETSIPLLVCPSRRPADPWPQLSVGTTPSTNTVPDLPPRRAGRSDYAINSGDFGRGDFPRDVEPPRALRDVDSAMYRWPSNARFTGISFFRSTVASSGITDGLSRTYLLGEKYVDWRHYATGEDRGDNENLYTGFNNDNHRAGSIGPSHDTAPLGAPAAFGSAHATSFSMAMCDGSVMSISYAIDWRIHGRLANRRDGRSLDWDRSH